MRVWLTRLTSPFIWRSPRLETRLLSSFARAEASSHLDLLLAANATASPARRALYLQHALDEARHARMFAARAAECARHQGKSLANQPQADYEGLFERLGELGFLAFVHRGERRGRRQFEVHCAELARRGDARGQALFETILLDEGRHERYTGELLVEMAGSPRAARRALRCAAGWEAWRLWRRTGRALGTLVYVGLMIALYFLLAPAAWVFRWRRPTARGFLAEPERPTTAPRSGAAS